MKTTFKPLVAALALAALSSVTHAAYFDRVDYTASGGYSALTNGVATSDAAMDLSGPTGDVALLGANTFSSTVGAGTLDHSYAADAFLSFSTTSTSLSMSVSQSLMGSGANAWTVANHQQDAFVDLSAVTLKIMGQAGEAQGSAVNVSFSGNASALFDYNSVTSGYMGMSVSRGNTVVGEYLWDVQQAGSQNVNFSFAGAVGEELTFSSYMLTGITVANASFAPSSAPFTLAESGASLNGNFTIAAVPEPETYAMLLAGLGLMGCVARRRKSK
jgi:hypothetical protein